MKGGFIEHSYFEELGALASIGQISAPEYQKLLEHMAGCLACKDSYEEFVDLIHRQLPLATPETRSTPKAPRGFENLASLGYKARFAARAKELGIHAFPDAGGSGQLWARLHALVTPISYQTASAVVIVALLVIVGLVSYRWKEAEFRNLKASEAAATLKEQNVSLRAQISQLSHNSQDMEAALSKMHGNNSAAVARFQKLQEQAQNNDAEARALQTQLNAANQRDTQTEQKLEETQQALTAMDLEIAKLRSSHANDEATLISQQVEMADLSRRAKEQTAAIDQQQKLLAVDQDVRNLMAARSLHITDVFDVDGKGGKKRAFGRVFYTEGKSLIFYAFDLENSQAGIKRTSFQAWGQLGDSTNSAVSLGLFYVDDPSQRRWILKFDNPEVLKQINAVFVTAEAHGGAPHPSGQKLMYAYFGNEPNHP
jgi:hypothetical protein